MDIKNEEFNCVSLSGARAEAIALDVESLGEQIQQDSKVCILQRGNNLHEGKQDIGETTMTLSLSYYSMSRHILAWSLTAQILSMCQFDRMPKLAIAQVIINTSFILHIFFATVSFWGVEISGYEASSVL